MTQNPHSSEFEESVREAVDDVIDSVRLVIDAVVGHSATLFGHVMQHVDRLVDDVVTDARDVVREAEALFTAACGRADDGDDADDTHASL